MLSCAKEYCWLFFVLEIFGGGDLLANNLGCLGKDQEPVEYWVIIKPPNTLEEYYYRDDKSPPCLPRAGGSCFDRAMSGLSDERRGPLALTLNQLFDPQGSIPSFLFYNDDPPFESIIERHSVVAHAKGVVAADTESGFWLIHSLPRFPAQKVGGPYRGLSSNARMNGQIFFCLSLSRPQIHAVGEQLSMAHPNIYDFGGFKGTSPILDSFSSLLNDELQSTSGQVSVVELDKKAEKKVFAIHKSSEWGRDFYHDLVAQEFQTNLVVNSWGNGQGTLPSYCRNQDCRRRRLPNRRNVCLPTCASNPEDCYFDFDVQNVDGIRLNDVQWRNTKDHSKWAVSLPSSETHVFCVGDLNRQRGQRDRGGGAICLLDESLWQSFINIVDQAEMCNLIE